MDLNRTIHAKNLDCFFGLNYPHCYCVLDKKKKCKRCSISNFLAQDTIGPFLSETQEEWADVRAGEVTFNGLWVPRRARQRERETDAQPTWGQGIALCARFINAECFSYKGY